MGQQPDVNHRFLYEGMLITPLILSVIMFKNVYKDSYIIKALLEGGADINYAEQNTGLTALMICSYLESEQNASHLMTILCETVSSPNLNQLDFGLNTALHHAALNNKQTLCEYLIGLKVFADLRNSDKQLPVDMATEDELVTYLSTLMKKSTKKIKKAKKFKKEILDFQTKYEMHTRATGI